MEGKHSLYIKNMVCDRCILVVDQILKEADIDSGAVTLGKVELTKEPTRETLGLLDTALVKHGFERIDDKKSKLLELIKTTVIEAIHHYEQFDININWSYYLADKLNQDYHYLSNLFSTVTGITLEQYIIKQKIEKAKEFLFYDELSVKEISYKLGYSSVAHLSSQFKKVTGFTPTEFKKMRENDSRKTLDNII
ncbi:AraC family transcriptional regulator [Reichenbachiella sp. MALMAid0571]|uniref:helix-turn-helix domain-containing protein n=1 Tax=Reichenbachiella sp. MALMAid0571 TaxID=3143939 RepID=UPI0032DF4AFA